MTHIAIPLIFISAPLLLLISNLNWDSLLIMKAANVVSLNLLGWNIPSFKTQGQGFSTPPVHFTQSLDNDGHVFQTDNCVFHFLG